ncbi:MAG: class I poly(R)-hydroxyalkanoic acid synthase [Alphaproteobacteria bacterium]|nr:class I poly(R)-hydroxyalkanoic acid synthase [Alphaproteobacteria bacterium]
MSDQQGRKSDRNGAAKVGHGAPEAFARIAQRSQTLVAQFLENQAKHGWPGGPPGEGNPFDPLNIGPAFFEMTGRLANNPSAIIEAQMGLWRDMSDLWGTTARRMAGENTSPVIEPAADDRRFADAAWNDSMVFDFFKQSYLLSAKWLQQSVRGIDGLDDKSAQKVDFYTRQFIDAMAPSNFIMTNPQVLRETIESGGENLLTGRENLLSDLEKGGGRLQISQTDEDAFEVGRNLGITPGSVVYRNDLFELIQYQPTTKKVARRPLFIVPPWINKYYILDLNPKKSFVAWCVDQGLTVFALSWINPDATLAEKTFEDYVTGGLLSALDRIEAITGEATANVVGYCLGGTLLAASLGYLAAAKDARVHSASFFASMIDFTEPGELGVFIDEEQLTALEAQMAETGYLDGKAMAGTFNMLRANDLIWSFVVNNYLLGKDPFPFDLLYWNADATRMPAAMHSFYLRRMYQENKLAEPGGLTLGGKKIDLGAVKTPSYFLSTEEDHIAPWRSTYAGMSLFAGPTQFCLAGSGHIAGVVNPPSAQKYFHRTGEKTPPEANSWLDGAARHDGSWWPAWRDWLRGHDGGEVAARALAADGGLGPAPGTFVHMR